MLRKRQLGRETKWGSYAGCCLLFFKLLTAIFAKGCHTGCADVLQAVVSEVSIRAQPDHWDHISMSLTSDARFSSILLPYRNFHLTLEIARSLYVFLTQQAQGKRRRISTPQKMPD